jgi:putative endonuclease
LPTPFRQASVVAMTGVNGAVGSYGERVAARVLIDAGMVLLDRNWRDRTGELDIVARDGEVIVFCEVKTRRSDAFGTPAEAVGPAKARRLRRVAAAWFAAHPHLRGEARFDVVSVRPQPRGAAVIEHLRDVI